MSYFGGGCATRTPTATWSPWSATGFFVTATDTWYLAEGCTAGGFETWVLVQNPADERCQSSTSSSRRTPGPVSPPALQNLTIPA